MHEDHGFGIMRVGGGLWRDGSYWTIREIITEHNRCFQWLKVVATWSWLGPMPRWYKESRTFLIGRCPLQE